MLRKTLFAIFGVGVLLGLAALALRARADESNQGGPQAAPTILRRAPV